LGGAALRESEATHLFTSDISYDKDSSQAEVLLADPTYGPLFADPKEPRLTRQAYLKERFGLVPRDQLSLFDLKYSGWKGMRFQKGDTAGVTWLHPSFGVKAWDARVEHLSLRNAAGAKHHLWYFVNFKHNTGEPLTRKNMYKELGIACKKLSLRSPRQGERWLP
jgi:hypothetical protein